MKGLDAGVLCDVTVATGKYRFVYYSDGRPPDAYRHGERWDVRRAAMLGDQAFLSLVATLAEAQELIRALQDHEGAEGWSEVLSRRLDAFWRETGEADAQV